MKDVVIELPDERKVTFPCDQWFDKKAEDGRIERDLFPLVQKSHRKRPIMEGELVHGDLVGSK